VFLRKFAKVAYYSVQLLKDNGDDDGIYEYKKFSDKMKAGSETDKKQIGEIQSMINNIGNYGANKEEFKRGNSFERLPRPEYKFKDSDGVLDYGLRLYCVVPNEKIVILLNGCRKTHQSAQMCNNCQKIFDFANNFSKAFYEAVNMGERDIELDEYDILTEDGYYLEF